MNFLKKLLTRPLTETDDPIAEHLIRAEKTPSARVEFYHSILERKLWIPGQRDGKDILIRPYTVHEKKALLFYSTKEKLEKVLGDCTECFVLPGRQLLQATESFEVRILNYATDRAKEFTRTEITAMLNGTIFDALQTEQVETSRVFILGQPKKYPVQLMEEIKLLLAEHPAVQSAYIALMFDHRVARDEPDYVIAFDTEMPNDDFRELVRKASELARATGTTNVIFTDFTDATIAEYMRSEVSPFYRLS